MERLGSSNMQNGYYRRELSTASAANSIVSGLGFTQIVKEGMISIRVEAKDSSGSPRSSGGDLFVVKISNV